MRLIDADALMEQINDCVFTADMTTTIAVNMACRWIDNAPTIEPEPHWIPCSERLPKSSETVLITHRGGTSFGWYNGMYWERGAGQSHRAIKTVTAWMPLPKPYWGE